MSKLAFYSAVLALTLPTLAHSEDATPSPSPAASTTQTPPASSQTPLDTSLRVGSDDEVSNVFRDMGVVQRRAMHKGHRFLLSTYAMLDFSDGPYTNYAFSVNPGYAISDFFEVYALLSPLYIVSPRSIVDEVSKIQVSNSPPTYAFISAAKPKYQYGVEVLWAPLYGKDSLGMNRILRSDTFLKLGVSQIQYDTTTGLSFRLGVGKTFFMSRSLGLRFCIDYGYIQSVVNDQKSFKGLLLSEIGTTFYF